MNFLASLAGKFVAKNFSRLSNLVTLRSSQVESRVSEIR